MNTEEESGAQPEKSLLLQIGQTTDGLLAYTYKATARYALKLPERSEEIFLPNADSVGQVLLDSGRRKISKYSVYDYFNKNREKGKNLFSKLQGATIRRL